MWFDTCELTIKEKYVFLSDDLDSKLEEIKRDYIAYKEQILTINSSSYLEYPYESLIMLNYIMSYEQQQQKLSSSLVLLTWLARGKVRVQYA